MNAPIRVTRVFPAPVCFSERAAPQELPETPCFDGEIGDLMTEADSELLSFEAFANAIEEELFDLLPERGQVARILLAAVRSKDPSLKVATEGAQERFEALAERMLETTWKKGVAA